MKLIRQIQIVVIIASFCISCKNISKNESVDTNPFCLDVNYVLENIERHLCIIYKLIDEPCLNEVKNNMIRITIWGDRDTSYVFSLLQINNCTSLTTKIINPNNFNFLTIKNELKSVNYSVKKNSLQNIDFIELVENCKMTFKNYSAKDKKGINFFIEIVDNDEKFMFTLKDLQTKNQFDFIQQIKNLH